MSNLINWSEVSRLLTNDRTAIRADYNGKKYKHEVLRTLRIEKALNTYLKLDKNQLER